MADKVCWDTDGTLFRVYSDNDIVLETPLPVLDSAPPILVGQDPLTGLPVFCPNTGTTLNKTMSQGGGGADMCTQIRCGAAVGMTDNMKYWYSWFRGILGSALTVLGTTFGALLVTTASAFIDGLTAGAGLVLTPEEAALVALIAGAVPAITGAALSAALPDLGVGAQAFLQNSAFCVLGCASNTITLTGSDMSAWQVRIAAGSAFLVDTQRDILAAIALWGAGPGLLGWVQAAQTGATIQSHVCDSYVCT